MKKKNILALACVFLMMIGILSGCGGGEEAAEYAADDYDGHEQRPDGPDEGLADVLEALEGDLGDVALFGVYDAGDHVAYAQQHAGEYSGREQLADVEAGGVGVDYHDYARRYDGAYAGGLCEHSLNVYHCLTDYLARERVTDLYGLEYSPESIALVALLHDVCKIGCYKPSTRNVKGEDGKWTQVPTFTYEDPLPYGHGEKSVYVVNGFVRLTREEAMAIRWHMGFSGDEDKRLVGQALQQYPLAFALSVADMEATYFLEKEES